MLTRTPLPLAAIACTLALALAGCGGSTASTGGATPGGATSAGAGATTSGGVTHATTKFLLHTGLALGAFHHFIYKPFKAGDLRHPLLHKVALAKAALAGLFIYHELELAAEDARSSELLEALFSPLTRIAANLALLKSTFTAGRASKPRVEGVRSELESLQSAAASDGSAISEAVPSVSQLVHPSE
jgi:hypothetical protein